MGILDYFKPVPTWSTEKLQQFLKDKRQGDYNLIDVRQPREYESGHIPGALFIPLSELQERLREFDQGKTTITYCARGVRSRSAAAVLMNAGFEKVVSLEGGIHAWRGLVAAGAPEAGMAFFSPAAKPEELIALAWMLEDGSRIFYKKVAGQTTDSEARKLFSELTVAEEHHQGSLFSLYKQVSGKGDDADFPKSVLPAEPSDTIMEGGIRVSEALTWAQGRDIRDILELVLSLETNSYDLYLRMERTMKEDTPRHVFRLLSDEEKIHLDRLTELFERRL